MPRISAEKIKELETSPFKYYCKSKIKKGIDKTKPHFQTAATTYTLFSASELFAGSSSWLSSLSFAKDIKTGLGLIDPFIEVITIPASLQDINKNLKKKGLKGADRLERNLIIASRVVRLGCAALSGIKITETIGLPMLGMIAKSYGNTTSIFQATVTSASSFTTVFSAAQILKTTLDIAIDCVHIHQVNKKILKVKETIKTWGELDWTAKESGSFAKERINHLQGKQITALQDINKLEGHLKNSCQIVNTKTAILDKRQSKLKKRKEQLKSQFFLIQGVGKIIPKIQLAKAKIDHKIVLEANEAIIKEFEKTNSSYNKRQIKIRNWKQIQNKCEKNQINTYDQLALNAFKNKQIAKLQIKKSNFQIKKIKLKASILLKTLVLVSLIASMVFTFVFAGSSGALITTAILMVLIALGEYGLRWFKRNQKLTVLPKNLVPQLSL